MGPMTSGGRYDPWVQVGHSSVTGVLVGYCPAVTVTRLVRVTAEVRTVVAMEGMLNEGG